MARLDQEFKKLCEEILKNGKPYLNVNRGVERLQIPSYTFRHSFLDGGFPILTLKEVPFYSVVTELIWFLRGDNNIKFLLDNGVNIWNKDAYNWYKKYIEENLPETTPYNIKDFINIVKNKPENGWENYGSVGQNYSKQWRDFNGKTDQIAELVSGMREDIMSSRLKVNAWNPSELNDTALPPCHSEFQVIGVPLTKAERLKHAREVMGVNLAFNISDEELEKVEKSVDIPKFGFELHWNQRSVDTFLGLPFNITSYALLALILEKLTGYPALGIEGTLKCVHFYDNQYEAVKELLKRDPDIYGSPHIVIPNISILSQLSVINPKDFKILNYWSQPAIKVDMLAPKKL